MPYSTTARITVGQPTPSSAATAATSVASWPTRRQACTRARSVSTERARIASLVSVHVRVAQRGSGQRQIRLCQVSTVGRPPHARFRTQVGRLPCATARTPQDRQNASTSTVSTSCSSSPPYSAALSTTNPGNPSALDAITLCAGCCSLV